MTFNRPDANYVAQPLPNGQRFALLGKKPPTAQIIDTELNALTDAANNLQTQITNITFGLLPGVNDLANNNKFASSVGGTFEWGFVETQNIALGAVDTLQLNDECVTTPKLGDGSVTAAKIFPNAVTADAVRGLSLPLTKLSATTPGSVIVSIANGLVNSLQAPLNNVLIGQGNASPMFGLLSDINIAPLGIGTVSLATSSVTTAKIALGAVSALQMANNSVTSAKINPFGANAGDVLTTDQGAATASWQPIPTTGQILQIVNFELTVFATATCVTTNVPVSFNTPFALKITPKSANSKIIIAVTASMGSSVNTNAFLTIYKNNAKFKTGSNVFSTNGQQTFSFNSRSGGELLNASGFFYDVSDSMNEITYEVRGCADAGTRPVYLNGLPGNANASTISTLIAVEVQI